MISSFNIYDAIRIALSNSVCSDTRQRANYYAVRFCTHVQSLKPLH